MNRKSYLAGFTILFILFVSVASGFAAVAVSDNTAFLNLGTELLALDVTIPESPVLLSQTEPFAVNDVSDFEIQGSHLYVAADSGFRIFSISDAANPIEIGYSSEAPFARKVAVSGDYAYLTTFSKWSTR